VNRHDFFLRLGISLDLALEANELVRGATRQEIPGVREIKEQTAAGTFTTVEILNEQGAKLLGRPPGSYLTLEAPDLKVNNSEKHSVISSIVAQKIRLTIGKMGLGDDAHVLIVGLGNRDATPDALGPRVVEKCLITRHLYHYAPPETHQGLRPVSALAPGVLGITGIETAEIIKGVVERIQPTAVIAIDALAAQSVERISTTIQMADTGISPGSGVGNKRATLNPEFLGIPVLAIGIPTVVHAAVIIFESFEAVSTIVPNFWHMATPDIIKQLADKMLAPFDGQLTVTPKEIDDLIANTSTVLASALNQALHPAIGAESFPTYLH